MASSLFPQNQKSSPNNPLALVAEFKKFAQGMSPDGARRRVEELLKSGQMTQTQFEDIKKQVRGFADLLKI